MPPPRPDPLPSDPLPPEADQESGRPLHVSELRALEAAVLQEEQFHVVVIAGYLLFCLLAVCRFSDAMHAQDLSISQSGKTVLVEAGTNVHKTAHTKERKTMLLPLVALGHVLDSERSWAVRWMEVRQQQKLDKEEVILPAFSEQRGCWLDRPMSTAEGMLWLRDIVQLRCPSGETLTTHSLKTTLLAWSTMFGVLDFQQRRTLGHHVDAGVASPLTYGRDNVAVLQVAIARMLRAIVAHRFNPDLSRAARIDKEIEVLTAELDENHKLVAYGPLDTDDVSDIEEAEAVEEAVGQAELGGRIYIAAAKANGRIKQHRVSGILHFVGANEKLACGRKVSSFYRNIDSDLNHEWQIGLPEAAIASLQGQNLATFGQFAFVSSFQPGSPDETPFVTALTKVLGEPPSPGDLAGWRRLFFESHTLTMSDLRSRLDRRDDEPPRKLLMPERAERLEAAKTTLVGLTIDSQLEPAHKLVDVVVQQAEESTIRYIPLKDCLSRESELLHNKHEQAIEFKNDGTMRLSKRQKEIRADIGGDLKAKLAMQRLANAFVSSTTPPLVAEYKLITDACPAASCEYRLLRTLPVLKKGVIDGGFDDARGTQVDLSENFDPSQDVYGVFRTPAEFVKAALLAKHPIDAIPQIPDVLVRNVVRVLNDGPALTNAKRKLAVKKVQRLALSLQAGEVELHQSLNPEMQVVLKDKKLLLWKELMTLTDFHDKTLFDEVTKGFNLVGQAAFSEQFPHGFVPMQQTPQELRAKSIWLRKTAAAKCTASLKPDLDAQVWNQTLEECHKGWMRGPFTETQVTAMVGDPYWLATRRFALEQSDKIRLIDDGLASGLNSAFGTSNKLQLLDIDSLVSLLLRIQKLRLKASSGLCLSDGSTIQCHPSPAWEGNLELLGKTLDLKSAYKQLGPNMEDLWTRIIVVYDPHSQEPAYFFDSGHILLRNKEARVASLVGLVDQLLTDEKVPPGVAASLQGQLNFAQEQYMGSVLKPAMQFLGKIAAHGWHVSYKQELAVVHEVVVPENLLRHWKALGNKEQLIAELELFPIVVAFQQLQPLLQRPAAPTEGCHSREIHAEELVDLSAVKHMSLNSAGRLAKDKEYPKWILFETNGMNDEYFGKGTERSTVDALLAEGYELFWGGGYHDSILAAQKWI
ncbi:unnamed protein product [Durusdinium trenchii]|uniref:Uncharacterized protein n=1 Tax=Durusdinium trenchii TaxID=1381693 RepID=A0ABP0MYA2_9DINO